MAGSCSRGPAGVTDSARERPGIEPSAIGDDEDVDSQRGKLLIAGADLFDPNFRRAILLIADHDGEGAVGVILNRPSDVTVEEAAPELRHLVGPDEALYLGGPVQPRAAVVVAEFDDPGRASLLAFGSVGFLTAEAPESMEGIRRARVFAGYAGWGPGQLEDELEQDAWIVEPASPDDPFRGGDLWSYLLGRRGGEYELLARMPEDPSMN